MARAMLLICFLIALVGCDAAVVINVNVSDLRAGNSAGLRGRLAVSIPSCTSYEDSREPSKLLLEAQEMVPSVIDGSTYIECFSKGMNTYATFELPIALGVDSSVGDDQWASENTVSLFVNEKTFLGLAIPSAIAQRIETAKAKSILGRNLKPSVIVMLKNDTEEDVEVVALSVFFAEEPSTRHKQVLASGRTTSLTLSNVAVDRALKYEAVTVLLR